MSYKIKTSTISVNDGGTMKDIGMMINGSQEEIDSINKNLLNKLDRPSTGLESGKYFRIASLDSSGNPVLEVCDLPSADNSANAGIVKFLYDQPFYVDTYGNLYICQAKISDINNRSSNQRPITPYNMDYAIKSAMSYPIGSGTGRYPEWTSSEQKAAQNRLGLTSSKDWVLKCTLDKSTQSISVDLSDCSELYIIGELTCSGDINLRSLYSYNYANLIMSIGTNGYRRSHTRFIDTNFGFEAQNSHYADSSADLNLCNKLDAWSSIRNISNITGFSLNDASLITSGSIKIYAR